MLGDALASILIALVNSRVRVENISLVYLLVVLGLAAYYGRGPAIAASILAFLAYDFFFIPPIHVLTVNDPSEWFSLLALLATSLVIGQLTAVVQARAREALLSRQEAIESEHRTNPVLSGTDDSLYDRSGNSPAGLRHSHCRGIPLQRDHRMLAYRA